MSGNFGYELDLSKLTPEELELAKQQVAVCKEIRSTIQFGTFYRLLSPFEGNDCAWEFVAPDGGEVVLCAVRRLAQPNWRSYPIKLAGLEESAQYEVLGTGEQYVGGVLMQVGLLLPEAKQDFESYFVRLRRVQ